MQHDSLAAYSLSGYPLTVEGQWSNAHGLYLAARGGALVLREQIDVLRTDTGARRPRLGLELAVMKRAPLVIYE